MKLFETKQEITFVLFSKSFKTFHSINFRKQSCFIYHDLEKPGLFSEIMYIFF